MSRLVSIYLIFLLNDLLSYSFLFLSKACSFFTFSECYLNCFRARVKTNHANKEQPVTHYTDPTASIANEVQGVLCKVTLQFVSETVIFISVETA